MPEFQQDLSMGSPVSTASTGWHSHLDSLPYDMSYDIGMSQSKLDFEPDSEERDSFMSFSGFDLPISELVNVLECHK